MAKLAEIVAFLDRELSTAEIKDYSGAWNGIQVENDGEVSRVVSAVDASLPVIRAAAEGGPGLLLVHHGLFWQGVQPLTGPFREKIRLALDAGLAIYSSHLPLDVHPEWGNNVLLARAIGLGNLRPFMEAKGQAMGLQGEWRGSRDEFTKAVARAVDGAVHVCAGGAKMISSVGIITGGAGAEVAGAAAAGLDAFVTGEGPHWSYTLAEELGINVFYAGHYATEVFGVKRLAEAVAERWQMPFGFIDRPTGL